jgi:hypothetical protein
LVRLRLLNTISKGDILPTYWEDNYVTLFPGDAPWVVTASYEASHAGGHLPELVESFNNAAGN